MRPKKSLGQNFLISSKVAEWIVNQLEAEPGETVLEIGPGKGALTEKIPDFVSLKCIEIDERLKPFLEGFDVIWGDALETEWPEFDRIISNLPYQISSPVVEKLIGKKFKKGIFGLQKEFAERLTGKGKRSRLTAVAEFAFDTKILKVLGKGATKPAPKVKMAIVSIEPKKLPENWKKIRELIDLLFIHPRKTVRSALKDENINFPNHPLLSKRIRKLEKKEIEKLAMVLKDRL